MKAVLLVALCSFGIGVAADAKIPQNLVLKRTLTGKAKSNMGKMEPYKIQYLQLAGLAAKFKPRMKINSHMKKEAKEFICANSKVETDLTYMNKEAMSINQHYQGCVGAYENYGNKATFYDLKSGAVVDMETQFVSLEEFKEYAVGEMLKNLPKDVGDCGDLYKKEALSQEFLAYKVVEGSLVVEPSFSHLMQACGFETQLPFGVLQAFVKQESTLGRTIRADLGSAPPPEDLENHEPEDSESGN